MWWTLVGAVTPEGISEADLQRRTAVSRRALRTAVTGAARAGWVTAETTGARRGGKVVRLTDDGVDVHRRWPFIAAAAEKDWRQLVGSAHADLADAAAAVVSQFELEWPGHPVSYGGADPSITGGSYRPAVAGPPRVPAHGQDWLPVVRTAASGNEYPVEALLSKALTAFGSDYEQHRVGAIPLALALRHASDRWVPVSEFPKEAGVTGEGKSLLERHGIVELAIDAEALLAAKCKGNLVRPSASGRAMRDAYTPVARRVEDEWGRRYGEHHIARLRALLETVSAELPPGMADYAAVPPPSR